MSRHLVDAVEVTENQIHLIRLKGIFDASTVSEFEKVVSYLLTRNFFCMAVDLSAVEFISSAGWGAFTAELRRVRENNGDIKLAGMSADLFDVFLLLELDRFINAYETADEALLAFLQPSPEPVTEEQFETAGAMYEHFESPAVAEASEIEAPPVYGLASSTMRESRREKYEDDKSDVYVHEPRPAAVVTQSDDYWTPRQSFRVEETLKIEHEQRRLGSGRERRERLLTSGPATIEYANVPRILPPALLPPPEDSRNVEAEQTPEPQYDINDAGSEAELDFYEQDSTFDQQDEPIAADDSIDPTAAHNLRGFGDGPLPEKARGNGEFFELSRKSAHTTQSRPRKFSWQEAEAFSELSLDLESHLQAHNRSEETNEDLNTFEDVHDEKPSPLPASSGRLAETQQFNTIVFSADEALPEDEFHDDVNFDSSYTAIADLKSPVETTRPIFENDVVDFGRAHTDEPPENSPLNSFASAFQFSPNVNNQRMKPEHDEDFETQDIRDPWILEEIDTLPEEYEIDDTASVYEDQPIAAGEFAAFNFENEIEAPSTPILDDIAKYPETSFVETEESEAIGALEHQINEAAAYETSLAADLEISVNLEGNSSNEAVKTLVPSEPEESLDIAALSETREVQPELPTVSPIAAVTKIPMSGNLVEMIRSIIAAYPHYGPTMIGKFLEERVEPPVYLSRSTIYRYLREANLSTRRQRLKYAGEEFQLADDADYEA